MPTSRKAFALLLCFTALLLTNVQAQDTSTYPFAPDSKIWIDGTSNKSDWTVHATEFSGHVVMQPSETEPNVESVHLAVVSKKIVSRKSSIMDRLMYKTLMVEEHTEIVYDLTSAEVASATGNTFTLNTTGNLTLAGATKEIAMEVQGEMLEDGQIRFTGSHAMKMSDFNIERPTAMYGALRTGDDLTVNFEMQTSGASSAPAGSQ